MHIQIWLDPEDVENLIKKALACNGYEAQTIEPQIDVDGNYTGFFAKVDYKSRDSSTYDRDR